MGALDAAPGKITARPAPTVAAAVATAKADDAWVLVRPRSDLLTASDPFR
jgi:hypothetical protein